MSEKITMPKNVQAFVNKYGGLGSHQQDSAFWKEFRKAANAYADVQSKRICDLEHALAEERKHYKKIEEKMRADLRGHPDSELWGESGLIAATMRCVDAVDTLTEQRDRLAEELKKIKKHLKDANRGAKINAHALKINTDKLIAATEQLNEAKEYADRLVEHKDMACLPADLENLRKANATFADENHNLKDRCEKLEQQLVEHKLALQSGDAHCNEMFINLERVREERDELIEAIVIHRSKAFPLTGEQFDQDLWDKVNIIKGDEDE